MEKNVFVEKNLASLIKKIVWYVLKRKYAAIKNDMSDHIEDLYQVGCLKALEMLPGYDCRRGRLETYLWPHVQGEISRWIKKNICRPRQMQFDENFRKHNTAVNECRYLSDKANPYRSDPEICYFLNNIENTRTMISRCLSALEQIKDSTLKHTIKKRMIKYLSATD